MKTLLVEIFSLIVECFYILIIIVIHKLINLFSQNLKIINSDVVLITGAARGIGKELVYEFAKYRPKCIILWDQNGLDELQGTVEEIKSLNIQCEFQLCDVSDFKDVRKKAEAALLKHKSVDILVNNAGIVYPIETFKDINIHINKKSTDDKVVNVLNKYYNANDINKLSKWKPFFLKEDEQAKIGNNYDTNEDIIKSDNHKNEDAKNYDSDLIWVNNIKKTLEVNVLAHFWTLHCFVPSMAKKNHGHIVSINSVLGLLPLENAEAYCSSKFAAHGLAECMKLKLANSCSGIFQTVVHPFMVNTEMFKGCETRFPWLFPPLDKTYVGKCIVQAVLSNQHTLYLPWIMKLFYYGKLILPDEVLFLLFRFLKLDQAMLKMKSN